MDQESYLGNEFDTKAIDNGIYLCLGFQTTHFQIVDATRDTIKQSAHSVRYLGDPVQRPDGSARASVPHLPRTDVTSKLWHMAKAWNPAAPVEVNQATTSDKRQAAHVLVYD